MEVFLIAIIIVLAYILYKKYFDKVNVVETYIKKDIETYSEETVIPESNYMPYAKGRLLTKTEQTFYITLVREALKRQLLVCPKVRLEDIIYVTDKQNRNKYRGYIKSRHVDFVLLDKTCTTVAAIELDDPSHNTAKAAKADQFKNELFYNVGIPLIRIYTGTDFTIEINYAFDTLKFPKAEIQKTTNQSQNS